MSEQQIMAEEMQSPKKVAFANRKYTNEERVKKEEEELEQLIAEQKGEAEQVEEPKEAEPKNADEIMEAIRTGNFIYDLSGSAR